MCQARHRRDKTGSVASDRQCPQPSGGQTFLSDRPGAGDHLGCYTSGRFHDDRLGYSVLRGRSLEDTHYENDSAYWCIDRRRRRPRVERGHSRRGQVGPQPRHRLPRPRGQLRRPDRAQPAPRPDAEGRHRHPARRRHDPRHRQPRQPVPLPDRDERRQARLLAALHRHVPPAGPRRPGGDRRRRHPRPSRTSSPSAASRWSACRRPSTTTSSRPPTASASTPPSASPPTPSIACTPPPKRTTA